MHVIIGIDPHKASHTAVAISDREDQLGLLKIRSNRSQVEQLRTWATGYPTRTWTCSLTASPQPEPTSRVLIRRTNRAPVVKAREP